VLAYGVCGLMPRQFWELSPRDFRAVVRGAQDRIDREQVSRAWMVAHLMNVSGKTVRQKVTVAQLLGRVVASKTKDGDGETES
jgi:hypothetical protein